MAETLYTIRMHACRQNAHLSGAERIAHRSDVERIAAELVGRAIGHSRGSAEEVRLTVEAIEPTTIRRGRLPDLTTVLVEDFEQGRRAAASCLVEAGVAKEAARQAIERLAAGAAPDGGSMRGAMLVDALSGERLESDPARGVRASRMDLTPEAARRLGEALAARGLDNPHVREALVLAAKVLAAPGLLAELCWSDDPDYTAGYVAAPCLGYVRFPQLKPAGEKRGGRAFFLRPGADVDEVVEHLERAVLLVDDVGTFHPDRRWED